MNKQNIIEGLSLFNEKTEKLFRLSFIKAMFETKSGASLSGRAKEDGTFELSAKRSGPGEEAIDAFVLTFRFFIQDNEKISLRNLAKFYESPQIEINLGKEFAIVRRRVNDFLDGPADILFKFENEKLSRRKIMETFIYGGLSHANEEKKTMYDVWMQIPFFRPLIENEFTYILARILTELDQIKNLNTLAVNQLQNQS